MLTRSLSLVLLVFVMLFAGGCDPHAEDKRQIQKVSDDLDFYNNTRNGAQVVNLFTAETFEHYDRLIKLGLDGTPQQVRSLPPLDKMEVLRMRMRSTRSELSKMTGRQYAEYATSAGWYQTPPEDQVQIRLIRFRFSGNNATAEAQLDRWKTGARMRFEKQDGVWKMDEPSSMAAWDAVYRDLAADEGMTVDEFLFEWLEDEIGRPVPESVWQPMRR